jgi:hypothetical protein
MKNLLQALGHFIRGELVVCGYGAVIVLASWVLFRHG